jgi:hypothetical protein
VRVTWNKRCWCSRWFNWFIYYYCCFCFEILFVVVYLLLQFIDWSIYVFFFFFPCRLSAFYLLSSV